MLLPEVQGLAITFFLGPEYFLVKNIRNLQFIL